MRYQVKDPVLEEVRLKFDRMRSVHDCFKSVPFISVEKRRYLMRHAEKNGLDQITRIIEGQNKQKRRHCNVDDFVAWVERGFCPLPPDETTKGNPVTPISQKSNCP